MTQIVDDPEAKPWYYSKTNWGLIVAAVSVFVPQKYKDLVGPTADTIGTIAGLAIAAYGRWHAGGVNVPLVGAKTIRK